MGNKIRENIMSEPLEPVSQEQLAALMDAVVRAHGRPGLWISGLEDADREKGRRLVFQGSYEMWTKDKKKITISMTQDGGLCVSCAKTADPNYPI
jgi:hypothetical protein